MNVTDMQLARTWRPFAALQPRAALATTAPLVALLAVALGLGAFFRRVADGDAPRPITPRGLAGWLAAMIALALLLLDPHALVTLDRYDFLHSSAGWLCGKLIVAIAALGWLGGWPRVRGDFLLATLLACAAVALREVIYDTYAAEIVLLGFAAACAPGTAAPDANSRRATTEWAYAALAGLTLGGCAHAFFAFHVKLRTDEIAASALAHERALRAGAIRPSEIAGATPAFRSWYLHAHATARPLPSGRAAAGYVRFMEPTPTIIVGPLHPAGLTRCGAPPPARAAGETIAAVEFRAAWFWSSRYTIVRIAPPHEPPMLGRNYAPVSFPLDDADWLALTRRPASRW